VIAAVTLGVLAAVQPRSATPAPKAPPPDSVTPGVWGFVVIFMIAVVVILLIMDMTRRIRRVRYRAEIAQKLDAEEAGAGGPGAGNEYSGNEPTGNDDASLGGDGR
jgi:hypothetical protein